MKKILFYIIIFFIFNTQVIYAKNFEIKTLASINNTSITNFDLFNEIKLLEIIENNKVSIQSQKLILNQLIDEKIKELETKEIKLNSNQLNNIEKKKSLIINKINNKNLNVNNDIKKRLKRKLEISLKWEKLIYLKFRNKIEVNLNEIESLLKSNMKNKTDKEKIINFEKQKKLQTISKGYFDQIKNKYLIEFY